MTFSSEVVLYRPSTSSVTATSSSSLLAARSSATSMVTSRLFSQQTGTAIATELLYRILFDIINRLLGSVQRLAAKGFEEGTSLLERKMQERRDRIAEAKQGVEKGANIVEEVGKLAEESGFVCPMMARKFDPHTRGPPGPPMWVRGVVDALHEGRMLPRDIWIQTHEG